MKRDMCVSELRFVANTAVTMQIAKLDLNGRESSASAIYSQTQSLLVRANCICIYTP